MESVFPIVLSLLGTVVTGYLVPFLTRKRKLAGAELLAKIAVDVLALVRAKNPDLKALAYIDLVGRELVARFKISESAARSIAAGAVTRNLYCSDFIEMMKSSISLATLLRSLGRTGG